MGICFARDAEKPQQIFPVEIVDPPISRELQKIVDILKDIHLLNNLSGRHLASMAKKLKNEEYQKGESLMIQGEMGDKFFIITQGVCEVHHNDNGTDSLITTLGPGDYCGEQALIRKVTRNATVKAKFWTSCLTLDRDSFHKILEDNNVLFAKREAKRKAIPAMNLDDITLDTTKLAAKSPEKADWLFHCIKGNLLFRNLSKEQNLLLIGHMDLSSVAQKENLITQGEKGEIFYVVQKGSFLVSVDGKAVQTISKGECTGELALIHNAPRSATVTAQEKSEVWFITRGIYRKVLTVFSKEQSNKNVNFLKNVTLFQPLLEKEISVIAKALYENTFAPGETIFTQGEAGNRFYVVKSGEVQGVVTGKKAEKFKLTSGEFFGEVALLKNEPRKATMSAINQVACLVLSRDDFTILMGPLEDMLSRQAEEYEKPANIRKLISTAFTERGDERYPTLEEFKEHTIGILGVGAFGTVSLVMDVRTKKSYALKAIRKVQILELGQHMHILNEKNVMAKFNSPFLVNLHRTYKDQWRIYFLIDACLGGELFTLLRKKQSFDESTARFYSGCVVEAFDYMHSADTIYRDLKPENLVMSVGGYLKVTDFGFAKVIIDTTYTLCGTPDYLAPEIVSGQGHGRGVDWWTLGILIYEMLSSFPPFYDEDQLTTYRKIINGKVRFPKYLSLEVKDLIGRLLTLRQTKRLGVIKGGASRIRESSWYQMFDWAKLQDLSMTAPYIPPVNSTADIGNFDKISPSKHEKLKFDPSKFDMTWEEKF